MAREHDEFFWISAINKATVVVEGRNGLFDEALLRLAAKGIDAVEKAGDADPAKRPASYIAYEPLLIAATNPEVTAIHAGRSSQDILSTMRIAIMRDRAMTFAESFDRVIAKILELARANLNTIVPNYTNGVAAQPTSYAHYLLGFAAPLLRDRARLEEYLSRYNISSMGAMVLNGTGWPLDRDGMAKALGFDRPVRNAFDATCEAPVDTALEFASIVGSVAIHLGSMVNDIMVQYAQPRPWILLAEGGENTYVSSAMPQKRNPGLMNNCRADCSDVVSEMNAVFMRVHNVVPGMTDGKSVAKNGRMPKAAVGMCERFLKVLNGLRINPARALEELNSDWTASQEIADRLMREHGLPFRIGHHMASRMVSYARANGLLPLNFPYAEIVRIYREEITEEFPEASPVFPMSEAEFRDALDPRKIVENRRTAGSARPSEVEAMIGEEEAALLALKSKLEAREGQVEKALEALDADFRRYL
ncbi:lyase family protein [Sutterella seckii]|uniref:argininosuccinate lyase n=2 Tax=Sutterella TaxID=40544 RepID=A0A6I1EPS5_9BURK|nr:lyase family protein [Sutterella seckii]KAB7653787.1 argininosuccinate lyase [Sutterella seckii]MBS5217141.1 argininosuccinate lyase [Sutterella wadsworthensis]